MGLSSKILDKIVPNNNSNNVSVKEKTTYTPISNDDRDSKENIKLNQEIISISNDMINYFVQVGYIDRNYAIQMNKKIEEKVKRYWDFMVSYHTPSSEIWSAFVQNPNINDLEKVKKLIVYTQQKVKKYYNVDDERKKLLEDILQYMLNNLHHKIKKSDFYTFFTSDETMLKDLFIYPTQSYRGILAGIWIHVLLENRIALADELLTSLYNNKESYNKVFDEIIVNLEKRKSAFDNLQIELLLKWSNYADKKEYSDSVIKNLKTVGSPKKATKRSKIEGNIELINVLKKDIIKNKTELSKVLKSISKSDKTLSISVVSSLVNEFYDNVSNNIELANSLFEIITDYSNTDIIIDNKDTVNKVLDIAMSNKERYKNVTVYSTEYTTQCQNIRSILSFIVNAYFQQKKFNNAITFVKSMIDKENKLENNSITYSVLQSLTTQISYNKTEIYIDSMKEIIDYSKDKELKDLFDEQVKFWKLHNNEELDVNNYILSGEFKGNPKNIQHIQTMINNLMYKGNLTEDSVDFESILEYVIKNKKLFVNVEDKKKSNNDKDNNKVDIGNGLSISISMGMSQSYTFDYITFYFEGLRRIESPNKLNSLINNRIIKNDFTNIYRKYNINEYSTDIGDGLFVGLNLKPLTISLLGFKHGNSEVINLMNDYINVIQDRETKQTMQRLISIIQKCHNDDYYNDLSNIDSLNTEILEILRTDVNNLPYVLYDTFIMKVCERNYKYVVKLLLEYIELNKYDEWKINRIDKILSEIYINHGFDMFKSVFLLDESFRNTYLNNIETKTQLVITAKNNSDSESGLNILKLLFDNIKDDNKKSILTRKLLFSTNYRAIILSQELDYLDSVIETLKNDTDKKELMRKSELLWKKIGGNK